jgi:hypothetical protein
LQSAVRARHRNRIIMVVDEAWAILSNLRIQRWRHRRRPTCLTNSRPAVPQADPVGFPWPMVASLSRGEYRFHGHGDGNNVQFT